ncbi:hypothetical protein RUND412_010917 [Rhizina undulata]
MVWILKYRYGKGGDGKSACPTDVPSYDGRNPIDDSHLLGCGLVIAYKDNPEDVQSADFIIFSVNDKCVNGLYQDFEVPAVPAYANGKCICAWFWEGQDYANKMMTGFECKVIGNAGMKTVGAGQPPKYCANGSHVSYPKQPIKWGYTNGAQKRYLHWILYRWFFSDSFREDPSTLAAAPNTLITSTRKSQATSAPSNDC